MKSNWIRTVRKKQGLKGFQLAEQLQVSPARVSVLEKDETRGAVTLKMMERVAKAMGCRFEYQIVPVYDRKAAEEKGNLKATANLQSSIEKPRYRVVQR